MLLCKRDDRSLRLKSNIEKKRLQMQAKRRPYADLGEGVSFLSNEILDSGIATKKKGWEGFVNLLLAVVPHRCHVENYNRKKEKRKRLLQEAIMNFSTCQSI